MDPRRAIDRSSTTERVAEALRGLMYSGELAPGEALREVALAESFGVARSTVREAMAVLAAEGLVRRYPNRGVVISALGADDVDEVFAARLVLETAGLRAAPAPKRLAALEAAMSAYAGAAARSDSSADDQAARHRVTEAHLGFHNALVGLLGNARLDAAARALTGELRLALATVERRRQNTRAQLADHRRLLRLVRAGDTRAAVAELTRHLDRARRSVRTELPGG